MALTESEIRARVLSRLPRPVLVRYVTALQHVRFLAGRPPEPHDWGHHANSRFVGAVRYADCDELMHTLDVLDAASPQPSLFRRRQPGERIGPPAFAMTVDMLSQWIVPLRECPQIVRMAAAPTSGQDALAVQGAPFESTSVLEDDHIVQVEIHCTAEDEADFRRALELDHMLKHFGDRVVDPPNRSLFCVTPEQYPELWDS